MIKQYKKISFAALLLPFILYSCLNNEDGPARTAADEQQEINEVIGNLISKGYNVDTTKLGSYYVMSKTGSGEFPKAGDTLSVIYTGFFLDGVIFDASYLNPNNTDSIWKFVYKSQQLISGFDEALSLMKKGGAADFIIPSKNAYGDNGYYEIPAFAPLGFSIKMKDIKVKN